MQKLMLKEAQRVKAIFDEMIAKLKIISLVPMESSENLIYSLCEQNVDYVQSLIQQQWKFEEIYLCGCVGKESTLDPDTVRDMALNIREIYRSVKQSSRATKVLESSRSTGTDGNFSYLIKYLIDFQSIICRQICTTVEEDEALRLKRGDITERGILAEIEKSKLQKIINATKLENEQDLATINEAIEKIRLERTNFIKQNDAKLETMRQRRDCAIGKANELHNEKARSLNDRIDKLNTELKRIIKEHEDYEALARKKKAKAEGELSQLINKYDEDMSRYSKEIAQLEIRIKEDEKEYENLHVHFALIDKNIEESLHEEKGIEAIKERIQRAQIVLDTAASKLQALYRGRKARAEVLKLQKKLKKGKKSKKMKSKSKTKSDAKKK